MYIDTHAHLNFQEYKKDLPQVLKRARQAQVEKIIVVGSDPWNSKIALHLANKHKQLYATIGVHPLHVKGGWGLLTRDGMPASLVIDDDTPNDHGTTLTLVEIEEMLVKKKIVALGEIGLDYHKGSGGGRIKINRDIQYTTLSVLTNLAIKRDVAAIFHCRDAMKDFFNCLKKEKVKGVIHCFPGDVSDAKKALDRGLYLSFTGIITFSHDFDEVIKYMPLDRLMIETDCPFLSPEPHRGKRNEPAYVIEVAKRIAEIKNVSIEKVAKKTTENARKLFGI